MERGVYCDTSRLRVFIPRTSARPVGVSLPRTLWVELNRLRTGVGRFHSYMHKWGLAASTNCECGTVEQTPDHVPIVCPIYWAPHGARGLTVLDNTNTSISWMTKLDAVLTTSLPASNPGSTAAGVVKRLTLGPSLAYI